MIEFRLTKKRIIIFAVLFGVVFVYLPILNCISDYDVKEKFCTNYGFCTVDIYYSMLAVILEPKLCPEKEITSGITILITLLITVFSYLLTVIIDYMYIKYRDK